MNRGNSILTILVVFAILFIATTGCYEPTEYDTFDSGDQVVVIEGHISDMDSVSTVLVSRSVPATDTNDCEYVDDAIVFIKDDCGNSAQLESFGKGVYKTSEIKGVPGNSYLLAVEVDGERYNAIEKMPKSPSVDSIVIEYQDAYTFFDTVGYYVSIYSTQDDDTLQYYRVEVEKNGRLLNGYSELWLYEDAHLANVYKMTIPYNFDEGDTVVLSVHSLSSAVYEYYMGLSKQFTTNFSNIQPPFTNPNSNIRTAMGCFQATSIARFSFIVPSSKRVVFYDCDLLFLK